MRRRPELIVLLLPLVLFLAGCDLGKPGGSTTTATPTKVIGAVPTTTQAAAAIPSQYKNGDPTAGKQVFLTAGCTGCHTLKDANSHGTVGPNLDDAKPPLSLAVARVTNGQGAMPPFKGQLSEKQIQDVAAYVSSVAGKS